MDTARYEFRPGASAEPVGVDLREPDVTAWCGHWQSGVQCPEPLAELHRTLDDWRVLAPMGFKLHKDHAVYRIEIQRATAGPLVAPRRPHSIGARLPVTIVCRSNHENRLRRRASSV